MNRSPSHTSADAAVRTSLSEDEIRRLQEIEDNAFDAEDEALFAMFAAKGWTADERIAFLKRQAAERATLFAAE